MDEGTAVTVDMVRPYLTERGAVEVDYAVERLRNRLLANENARLNELVAAAEARPELESVNGDTG